MYLYNVTIKIDWIIETSWLEWMLQTHIPELLLVDGITKQLLLKLKEVDEQEGPTYALQLFIETKAQYTAFVDQYLPKIAEVQKQLWGGKMMSFATLMEIVH